MIKIFRIFVLSTGLVASLLGGLARLPKTTDTSASARTPEWVVGEFSSLSGPQAPFGRAVHLGIQLAFEETNREGGVAGRRLRLLTYDDRGEPAEVARLVERLATADQAVAVLGEVSSGLSLVAAPIAQRLKVPMISPGSTHPDVTAAGPYVFRVCFSEPFQGEVNARFALDILKLKKALVVSNPEEAYSEGLADYFSRSFRKRGGVVLSRGSSKQSPEALRAWMKAALAQGPDLLFLPLYFNEVGPVVKLARELGFQGALLGGDGWEGRRLVELAGPAIVGGYFSNHFSVDDKNPAVQAFVRNFRARYGEDPAALSAVGYDAARVTIEAIRRTPEPTREAVRRELEATRNYAGVTGIITIDGKRDAVKPAVVLKVGPNGRHEYVTTINP